MKENSQNYEKRNKNKIYRAANLNMKLQHRTFHVKDQLTLPVIHFKGKKKGPCGLIIGGMHGNELNGIILVKKFIDDFRASQLEQKMAGELIILPLVNLSGFLGGKRKSDIDCKDLNRSFPGKKQGTYSEKFAYELFHSFVEKADFGIDCHDAGNSGALLPHPRVSFCDEKSRKCLSQNLGKIFGSKIIVERMGKKGMLAVEAFKKLGKPIITIEIGGAKHIFTKYLQQGVNGIKNILRYYKMIPGKIVIPQKQYILKNRYGVRANQTGIMELNVKLGDFVHAGETIGTIYYPQNFIEKPLKAPMCGLIFWLRNDNLVKKGNIMYSILENVNCHVKRTTTSKFQEIENFHVKQIWM